VDAWTVVRFLHVGALALFVGGQLALVTAIVPVMRRRPDDGAMRAIGRRFGVASLVAIVILIGTGVAMAERLDRWSDPTLQVKVMLVVVVGVLTALHAMTPRSRGLSIALFAASLAVLWLGVELTHG
jgi:uncharacterized membrane protein